MRNSERAGEGISYLVDEPRGLVRVRVTGDVSLEDLMDFNRRIIDDPRFVRGMGSLVDLTGASLEIGSETVWRFRDFLQSIQEHLGPCRWAVVAPGDLHFGFVRMFQLISEDLEVRMPGGDFRELTEARIGERLTDE